MKQFLLILFVALSGYAAWVFTPTKELNQFRGFAFKHIKAVTAIFLVLIAAFFVPSINLL